MKSNVLLATLCAGVLASCSTAGGTATPSTALNLTATNYVTVTQTPTTLTQTTLPGATVAPGTVHPEEGSYTVATGDYPSTIAKKFKVPFQSLLDINGWTLVGQQVPAFPTAGTIIRIPPNWTEPGAAAAATGTTTAPGSVTPTQTTTTLAGGVSTCGPGEYTVVAGDYLGKVATKLNTTVAELDAANASTPGYKSFYPGLKIKTPPKANC